MKRMKKNREEKRATSTILLYTTTTSITTRCLNEKNFTKKCFAYRIKLLQHEFQIYNSRKLSLGV